MATKVAQAQLSTTKGITVQQLDEPAILYGLSKELSSTLDGNEVQRSVLRWAKEGVKAEVAALLLPNDSLSQPSWSAYWANLAALGSSSTTRIFFLLSSGMIAPLTL